MWFDSWYDLARIALVGTASYVTLIVLIRVSGKRTLTQLSAFDLVVTVSLGSVLATVLLTADVSFLEGVVALLLLLLLQVLMAWAVARSRTAQRVITAPPTLLLRDGRVDDEALRRARVSRGDLEQAVRQSGEGDLGQIAAVVLESSGSLSIITKSKIGDGSSMPKSW
ncbi:DUF421 domain-containing protein [Pseudoclavibacter sp. RFBA6]|uniref:DUF421 domain-containing protein n=1 Tax=Pseudoclavibacter sp. RFBA6 TaxID=2080573 RepID=UPI000CE8619A|nr:YetF domain-containing protein [Pseudoclavibacter sp. RFBA6]PPG42162.1 DUF421 domain-containing protein [Pseudoclavibacter sp. RFBA6]